MTKSRKNIISYLLAFVLFLITTALFMMPMDRASADGVTASLSVKDNTKNVTIEIDYYNDCYKDSTAGYYGYTPANSIVYVDRNAVANGAFLVANSRGAMVSVVSVSSDGNGGYVASAPFTPTNTDTSDYTVTIPEDGYILLAKGTDYKAKLAQIEANDSMSLLQLAQGVKIATDETLKQSLAIAGENTLIENKTTMYTEGYFRAAKATRYRVITAVYKDSKYVVASNVMVYNASATTDVIVPNGGLLIVSSGYNYFQNDPNSSYAQPFMQKVAAGDVIALDYVPENVGRYVVNKATNAIIPIHFYNDYYKGGYTPGNSVVCIDRKAVADGAFKMDANRGTWSQALLVTGDGAGNYTAGTPYVPGAAAQTITIPQDGYLLLAKGATEKAYLTAVANGNAMSGICESKQAEDTLVMRTNNGYYVLDVAGKINENKGTYVVYTNTTVTDLVVNTDRYILANYDAFSEIYIVSSAAYATTTSMTVAENQILIVADGTLSKNYNYAKPAVSAYSEVASGTVIEYNGYKPQVEMDVKVNGIAIDGVNPVVFVEGKAVGKTIIYTSTEMRERNTAFGSEINKSYRVTTYARSNESNVRNYMVKMVREGQGYKHIVTQIVDSKEAVQIPYDGYVISVPVTKTELYNLFEVGDEVTLSGDDAQFRVPVYVVDNKTKNIRMEINGMNDPSPTYSNWVILYDSAFGEETDPAKAYRYRKVVTNGVVTGENTAYGSTSVGVTIPTNGFVLTGNGQSTGVVALSSFAINDVVEFYNIKEKTDATLSNIKLNGGNLVDFSANRTNYYIYLEEGSAVPSITYTTTNSNATAQVLNTPTAIPGSYEIKVTAEDGVTEKLYTVSLYPDLSKDTTLSTISVNGKEWTDFDASKVYCNYYILKGGALPTFSAVATDEKATVTITQASASDLTATIQVVAEDTGFAKIYEIVVVEVDLSLTELKVGDTTITLTGEKNYTVTVAKGTEYYPIVEATAKEKLAQVKITQANAGTGKAVITVSNNGLNTQYTINFILEGTAPTDQPIDDSGCTGSISATMGLLPLGLLVIAISRKKREE